MTHTMMLSLEQWAEIRWAAEARADFDETGDSRAILAQLPGPPPVSPRTQLPGPPPVSPRTFELAGKLFLLTHNGSRYQRDWRTIEEVEAADLETLREWCKVNDRNGDYDDHACTVTDDPWTHAELVSVVIEQAELDPFGDPLHFEMC